MRERSHPFGFLFFVLQRARRAAGDQGSTGQQGSFMAAGFPAKYGASFLGLHFWQNPDRSFAEHPGSFRVIQKW
jgi:hypothetical protein